MRKPPPKTQLPNRPGQSKAPPNIKESVDAQRAYARKSQLNTQHFDTSSRRLDMGNPDVGNVDLGNIEANRPAQPDDNDHFD